MDYDMGEVWRNYCRSLKGKPTRIDYEQFKKDNEI